MDERYGHRALADRAGHPLGRAAAYVSRGEEPRHARLQRERVAVERPIVGPSAVVQQVRAREDVAGAVGAALVIPLPAD